MRFNWVGRRGVSSPRFATRSITPQMNWPGCMCNAGRLNWASGKSNSRYRQVPWFYGANNLLCTTGAVGGVDRLHPVAQIDASNGRSLAVAASAHQFPSGCDCDLICFVMHPWPLPPPSPSAWLCSLSKLPCL